MGKYSDDKRIVMTLDAGGTKFLFSAIQGDKEVVQPVILSSEPSNLDACLGNLVTGFRTIREGLPHAPVAISFAFPGPADYVAGIIGDLPNFPSFRGGVALKSFLENIFKIPVFINNDGGLFAYGEALAGVLPEINKHLEDAGNTRRYNNVLGVTLGTGFGAGVVINGTLLHGDNGVGGYIWCFPNAKYPGCIVEESVSIRAVKRVYTELSGDCSDFSPKEILEIAEGTRLGNKQAAIHSFTELGEAAGDAIASALTLIDGIVVIGGGLSGASKYIVPSLIKTLNGPIKMLDGTVFKRLQMDVFNLDNSEEFARFTKEHVVKIPVPGTDYKVDYKPLKRTGILVSKKGASRSIAMGAYIYALNHL